jgi:ribosomal protein S3
MGQKVHPLGFRVGITKKHQSQWFARFNKYSYAQSVAEDFMLRKTLMKIFPELLSPVVKKKQQNLKNQANSDTAVVPKITQIKIERGLIPYEIGIQIHAENCNQIQSAIENLKLNSQLLSNLQKTRQYLSKVVSPIALENANTETESSLSANLVETSHSDLGVSSNGGSLKKRTLKKSLTRRTLNVRTRNSKRSFKKPFGSEAKGKKKTSPSSGSFKSASFERGSRSGGKKTKLSKVELLKIRNNQKRLKKRQAIRKRYLKLLSKGLLIRKNGNQILRKVNLKGFFKKIQKNKNIKLNKKATLTGAPSLSTSRVSNRAVTGSQFKNKGTAPAKLASFGNSAATIGAKSKSTVLWPSAKSNNLVKKLSNKLSKKFATFFINQVNQKLFIRLKALMKYWDKLSVNKEAPLGYNKKFSLSSLGSLNPLIKNFKKKSITQCNKLIEILEKKSLQKFEYLRKEFITFGTISKTRSFGYYQLITFLKQFKEFVTKYKKQSKGLVKGTSYTQTTQNLQPLYAKANIQKSLTQNVLNSIQVNNGDSPTMSQPAVNAYKLISYLQNHVQTYRNQNLFYYLSSMAQASHDYKQLKRSTKKHSNLLFGVDCTSLTKENSSLAKQNLQEKIEQILTQSNKKVDFDKNLQDALLEQVENQRQMYKANLALVPKISIQFFSVKPDNLFEKASVVADSVVDALEKRKAFRGVIKKAKEDLMRRSRVKGVKIQVAGRLNGAEIARSEWVRAGRVPLQTLRANIDYSYRTASTIYGIIGVKVWIFKGYY